MQLCSCATPSCASGSRRPPRRRAGWCWRRSKAFGRDGYAAVSVAGLARRRGARRRGRCITISRASWGSTHSCARTWSGASWTAWKGALDAVRDVRRTRSSSLDEVRAPACANAGRAHEAGADPVAALLTSGWPPHGAVGAMLAPRGASRSRGGRRRGGRRRRARGGTPSSPRLAAATGSDPAAPHGSGSGPGVSRRPPRAGS